MTWINRLGGYFLCGHAQASVRCVSPGDSRCRWDERRQINMPKRSVQRLGLLLHLENTLPFKAERSARSTDTPRFSMSFFILPSSCWIASLAWKVCTGPGLLMWLFIAATMAPGFAVSVPRMWWVLLSFILMIGVFVFILFAVQDSDPNDNKFGPNPKITGQS